NAGYNSSYTDVQITPTARVSHSALHRVGWRSMAAVSGYRTIYPSIIAPTAAHVDFIASGASESATDIALAASSLSTILVDFFARSASPTHLRGSFIASMPLASDDLQVHISHRTLLLNCLTSAFGPLWQEVAGSEWTPEVP